MLDFHRGNAHQPSGNLLVFCHVRGHNPVQPGGDLIVCNVVVSFVSARSNHFPVVIFPPTALESYGDLEELLELGDNYDLVQIEDFEIPPHQDEDEYVRERLDAFNRHVMDYVEMCREHIHSQIGDIIEPALPELPAPEQLDDLPDRSSDDTRAGLDQDSSGASEQRRPGTRGPAGRGSSTDTNRGSDASGRGRGSAGRGPSGRGVNIARFKGDEESALNYLESWVEQTGDPRKTIDRPDELHEVIRFLKSNCPQYDMRNFERVLEHPHSELPKLYLQKFRAIHAEAYEEAATIQSDIRQLESRPEFRSA